MKQDLKKRVLDFPGFESLCRTLTRNHVRSLMYHRFSPEYLHDARFVDPQTLETQIKYICYHYTVIDPDQHLEALNGRVPGRCPVAVTVDDGYADFHDVAYPIFREFGVPAMLFVATGFISREIWFWWDKLAYLMKKASPGEYLVDTGAKTVSLDLTSVAGRNTSWHRVADQCRFMRDERKESLLFGLADQLGIRLPAVPPFEYAPTTWDLIRDMDRNGIKFGAHTVHHPILTRVQSHVAAEEITESKKQLEQELGHHINWFAYPQGGPADFNDEVKEMVEKEFAGCYVAYQDMENRGDKFIMPRYCVTDDMTSFRWVLCGAEFLGLKVRKLLGLQTGATETYWAGSEEEENMHE